MPQNLLFRVRLGFVYVPNYKFDPIKELTGLVKVTVSRVQMDDINSLRELNNL